MSLLACALAPLLVAATVALGVILWNLATRGVPQTPPTLDMIFGVWSFAVVIGLYATPAMIVIGLPVQAWMSKRGWNAWWHMTLPAAVMGGVLWTALMPVAIAQTLAFGAGLGALCGFYAWVIRRPDRDHLFDAKA